MLRRSDQNRVGPTRLRLDGESPTAEPFNQQNDSEKIQQKDGKTLLKYFYFIWMIQLFMVK